MEGDDDLELSGQRLELLEYLLREEDDDIPQRAIIPRADRKNPLLSFAQTRLWFLDQLQPGSPFYNIPLAWRLIGSLNLTALQRSLSEIVRRHEVLHTTFRMTNGNLTSIIAQDNLVTIPVVDFTRMDEHKRWREVRYVADEETQKSFDLSRGPLLRAMLLRVVEEDHVVLITMHHIVSDEWSMGVFTRELATLYQAYSTGSVSPLPELPIQYADYALWQRERLQGPGVGGQGDKQTSRQGDKESGVRSQESGVRISGAQSPISNLQSPIPIPHPSPPPALRLSPIQEQLAYWRTQLADLPVLALPTDRPRPLIQSYNGAAQSLMLPASLSTSLRRLGRREGVTLFMLLLAAFKTLLYRYTGQTDIVVGSPIAGRDQAELEDLIGFFANTLVLRTDLSGTLTFVKALERVREVCLGAYAHQDLPFDRLVEELQPERDPSRNPLFQVLFSLQNASAEQLTFAGLRVSALEITTVTARVDLTLIVSDTGLDIGAHIEYNSDLFDGATIARLLGHYQTLLAGIIADPMQPIARLPLLTPLERRQLLVDWNATATGYPRDSCIHERFAQQALRTPDAIAAVYAGIGDWGQGSTTPLPPPAGGGTEGGGSWASATPRPQSSVLSPQSLTYRELNARANHLAHHLRALGVGPEVRVGLCLERSPEMLVGLLGILTAGGAYVPLDSAYPPARLAFMLEDSRAAVLITQKVIYDLRFTIYDLEGKSPVIQNPKSKIVNLDADWHAIAAAPAANPVSVVSPDNLAYVMYTSGSTGLPKGVEITHQNVLRLVTDTDYVRLSPDEVFVQLAPIAFDAATFEIWGSLLNGACLIVAPAEALSLQEQAAVLERYRVTTLWLTAGLFHQMVEEHLESLRSVQQLLAGGDVLSIAHAQRVLQRFGAGRLVNGYGPTEGTTFTCCYSVDDPERLSGSVPIGRPIANTQVYLLDAQLEPVPIGVAGELYIGGDGLARGYLGRPDLTAAAFIPNPFPRGMGDGGWGMEDSFSIPYPSPPPALRLSPNTRLYRTGDRARYRADGMIEFLGRMDQQVKLRGFRIEVGEIEAVLGQHPAVQEVVVLAREEAVGQKRLAAYVVPKIEDRGLKIEDSGSDAPEPLSSIFYLLPSELRAFLHDRLPGFMVPSAFVILESLPLSPNGKVDRQCLPAPEQTNSAAPTLFMAPQTPMEELVAGMWRTVLRVPRVGRNDNFFELGGHSLLATQILSRIHTSLHLKLPLRCFFENPTVAGIALALEQLQTAHTQPSAPPIVPVSRQARRVPLSCFETRIVGQAAVTGLAAEDPAISVFPLSFAQARLWFLDQLAPDNPFYNVPVAWRLIGALNAVALELAIGEIVRRHEVLRTIFTLMNGQPVQAVGVPIPFTLLRVDLQQLSEAEREAATLRHAAEEALRPFDLARGPLLRAALLHLGQQEQVLLLTMHHIVVDEWSIQVFFHELITLYTAYAEGMEARLPELPIQYADYAVWQRAWLEGSGVGGQGSEARSQESGVRSQESDLDESPTQNSKLKTQNFSLNPQSPSPVPARPLRYACPPSPIEAQLAYWRQQLNGAPAVLELPTDRSRPAVQSYRGASYTFTLPQRLSDELKLLSQRASTTLYMTLVAAWNVLLFRYTGQVDIIIGSPIAGRNRAEIEGLIGCFLNMLVLRTDLSGNPDFYELLGRVREVCLEAYAHQELPFERLVEELQPERGLSHTPFIQVVFDLHNSPLEQLSLPGLELRPLPGAMGTAKFDLSLMVEETDQGLAGEAVYSTDLFRPDTIARMLGNYQVLLEGIVAHPTQPIAELPLLTETERLNLLITRNDTTVAYSSDSCVHQLFAAQVERTPDAVAVIFDHRPPTTDHRPPTTDHRPPTTDHRPTTSDQRPMTNDDRPVGTTDGQEGTTDGQVGTTDGQEGTTDGQEGTTDGQEGATDGQEGATDGQEGTTDSQEGTTDGQVGTTDGQVGTTDSQVGTTDGQVGTTDGQVGTTDGQVGTTDGQVGTTDRPVAMTDRPVATTNRQVATTDRSPLHPFTPSPVQHLTYHELNERANRLAHHLRALGVGPEVRVGICTERSLELVVGLLGIFKSGGAFLPLEPAFPKERMALMLADGGVAVLLTQERLLERLPDNVSRNVCLDTAWDVIAQEQPVCPASTVVAENLAYVIYTSGSTGRPKGVMISHRGFVNYLAWCAQAYSAAAGRGAPVQSSIAADAIFPSLFAPLLVGTSAVLMPEDHALEALGDAVQTEGNFSLIKITPSQLEVLNQLLPQTDATGWVHTLVVGAEALRGELLPFWQTHAPNTVLLNEYGPTETVVGCSIYQIPATTAIVGPVPIGLPIANTQFYVLDRQLQLVPIGVPGELYIGGDGVARGYLGRPDLTAERFIPNPFGQGMGDGRWGMEDSSPIPDPSPPPALRLSPIPRLYKTGDLVRYLADDAANIEFLGRTDDQIKIRGYRIEPGEIATVLNQHKAVREAVVLAREDGVGSKRLVAYIVPKIEDRGLKIEDSASDARDPLSSILYPLSSELREFLKDKLPDYMVPSAFVLLETMPLAPHGKIDRKALPSPDMHSSQLEELYVAPRTPVEEALAAIWSDVLGVERVGVNDNFFELGGHSLLAIRLVREISRQLRRDLPLYLLFQTPTIKETARFLDQKDHSDFQSPIVAIQPHGSKRPFFCTNPGDGNALWYTRLAHHLGLDQPFYGLQDLAAAKDTFDEIPIEESAADYIRLMRDIQPEGPYLLGGWSFGGLVAFAMAHQLKRQGHEVGLLAIIDSIIPGFSSKTLDEYDADFLSQMAVSVIGHSAKKTHLELYTDLRQVQPDERLQYLLDRFDVDHQAQQVLDLDYIRRERNAFISRLRASLNYQMEVYPGRITLFRSDNVIDMDHPAFRYNKENMLNSHMLHEITGDRGWGKWSTEPVQIFPVPGSTHDTIILEPYVRVLAKHLSVCLE